MNIKKQVCSKEQAKRLKELGVAQKSYFVWGWDKAVLTEEWSIEGDEDIFYSAFTVAELGEMLPEQFYTIRVIDKHDITNGQWHCISQRIGEGRCYGATEAEARAAMLIHLIETKVITPPYTEGEKK